MGLHESNGSLGRANAMIARLRRATTEWTARLHKGHSESIRQQKGVESPPSSDYGTADESISSKSDEPRDAPHIPDLELLRCIGQGSYGEVWLARNILGTYRAVKII
jgi:hypothetical protein